MKSKPTNPPAAQTPLLPLGSKVKLSSQHLVWSGYSGIVVDHAENNIVRLSRGRDGFKCTPFLATVTREQIEILKD